MIDVNVRAGLWLPLFAFVETTIGSSEPRQLPSGAFTDRRATAGDSRKNDEDDQADNDAAYCNDVVDDSAEAGDGFTRIGEMAKQYGVTLRTLRFYEDKGLLSPKREGTTRLYTRRDIARLKLILLGRKVGFSLREVKQMIDLYDPTGSNTKQLKLTLDKSEKQLGRLEKQRAAIDEAISELTRSDRHRAHHAGAAPVGEGGVFADTADRALTQGRRIADANRCPPRPCPGGFCHMIATFGPSTFSRKNCVCSMN